jgi:hypothetical protein
MQPRCNLSSYYGSGRRRRLPDRWQTPARPSYGNLKDLRGTVPNNNQNWHFYGQTYDSVSGAGIVRAVGGAAGDSRHAPLWRLCANPYVTAHSDGRQKSFPAS